MNVEISEEAVAFYKQLPDKDKRIIKEHFQRLTEFPDCRGDVERLTSPEGIVRYRIHISRKYTAIFQVYDEGILKVHALMTIEQAHKKYKNYLKD
jgi:mRNA-degrading endonuclease RelE of RelBE toxin-antitoxin system